MALAENRLLGSALRGIRCCCCLFPCHALSHMMKACPITLDQHSRQLANRCCGLTCSYEPSYMSLVFFLLTSSSLLIFNRTEQNYFLPVILSGACTQKEIVDVRVLELWVMRCVILTLGYNFRRPFPFSSLMKPHDLLAEDAHNFNRLARGHLLTSVRVCST